MVISFKSSLIFQSAKSISGKMHSRLIALGARLPERKWENRTGKLHQSAGIWQPENQPVKVSFFG